MDGALSMRLREEHLGHGRNPLEGGGSAASLPEVLKLRPVCVAYGGARVAADYQVWHNLMIAPRARLPRKSVQVTGLRTSVPYAMNARTSPSAPLMTMGATSWYLMWTPMKTRLSTAI